MILLNMFLLCVIVCFVIDVSGFQDDAIKPMIARWLNRKSGIRIRPEDVIVPKPVSCSMCMCFWTCLIYLLVTHNFTLVTLVDTCGLALLASNLSEMLQQIKDFLSWIQAKINELLRKL